MIEISTQWRRVENYTGYALIPYSDEDMEEAKVYKPNQILRAKLKGTRKERSLQQLKWVHVMFRIVAENTDDPDWNTPQKVKNRTKHAMGFYDVFRVETDGSMSKVFFQFRSFAFDKMEPPEANIKFDEVKIICSKVIGVDPEELEAQAKERG